MLVTGAGEEVVAVFVEGNRHDPVCKVERLLDSITVVNINVKVQHTWMIPATVSQDALRLMTNCSA